MVKLPLFSAGTSIEVALREGSAHFSTLSALWAMSVNRQADFFGASRSVYWDVIFWGSLLSQAGLSQWSYRLRFPEILNPKEYCTQLLGVAQCFLIPAVLVTPQLVQMHMKMKKAGQ